MKQKKQRDKMTAKEADVKLRQASIAVDAEVIRTFKKRGVGPAARMYGMLGYFMGYLDEKLKPVKGNSGKRFRPGLALILADAYKARKQTFDAAIAIELFHNFTLIHDDVEDRDEMRRGKPTVWKLWGINDAINSGDAQNLLVAERIARVALLPKVGARLSKALVDSFIEVIEGQHLDFELAVAPIGSKLVSEKAYLYMTQMKTGVLVRIAAESAGIAAGKSAKEIALLRRYASSLGSAFQMADDYHSVWDTEAVTGKDRYSDIREHKRTLPFLHAYEQVKGKAKARLKELYSLPGQLTERQIREARDIIDATGSRQYVLSRIRIHTQEAQKAAQALSIPEATRAFLLGLIDLLVPEIEKF